MHNVTCGARNSVEYCPAMLTIILKYGLRPGLFDGAQDHHSFMQLLRVPKASENLEAATVGHWLKAEGDDVSAGDQVIELLTDKADFVMEAEEAGKLRRITAAEKSTVPVGYILGVIAQPDDDLPDIDAENDALMREFKLRSSSAAAQPQPGTAPAPDARPARKQSFAARKVPATPAARRAAKQHNVDLSEVAAGLNKKGVLSADDVEEYVRQQA